MSGLIKWKRVAIVGLNPEADSVYVGVDAADGQLYIKNSSGVVTKYISSSSLATVATTGSHLDLSNIGTNTHTQIDTHIASVANPHATTKAQVGLGSVDNTSDSAKPVSVAQQAALDLKANLSLVGVASGIASLDSGGKVPAAQLPSFVDDVLEFANLAAFPVTGETGKMYIALDTNKTYRWSGSVYVEISASPGSTDAVPEGVTNLYFTTARVLNTVLTGLSLAVGTAITAADSILSALGKLQKQISDNLTTLTTHTSNTSNPHATTKTQVGLGLVDNTADATKNVLSATKFTTARNINGVAFDGTADISVVDATKEPIITGTTSADFWSGAKTFINFATTVRNTVLTGIVFTSSATITAADSILSALGKLQTQINVWNELITTADITINSSTTSTSVTELGFTVAVGITYYFEYTIRFRAAATTTGIQLTVGTSNTAAGSIAAQVNIPVAADGTAALYTGSITALDDLVIGTGVPTIQPDWHIATIKGTFICTTAGTLVPKFRSEVNGSNVNFGTGSIGLVRTF